MDNQIEMNENVEGRVLKKRGRKLGYRKRPMRFIMEGPYEMSFFCPVCNKTTIVSNLPSGTKFMNVETDCVRDGHLPHMTTLRCEQN